MKPATPAFPSSQALLAAGLLLAWTGSTLAQGLSAESPFLNNADNGPAQASPADFQLAGISSIAGETSVCIVDSAKKKSTWLKVGGSDNGLEVVSCSLADSLAVVRVRGETRTLHLRAPAKLAGAKPAPAGPAPAAPQLLPPLPQTTTATASTGTPPPEIGPAGGQLPPVLPLTTREEQEREARMLVSDLMEIGMRQRKAYEEAQRAAKAEAAAKNGTTPPKP